MYIAGGGGVGGQEKGTGRRESGVRRRKEEWGGRPDIGSGRPGLSQREGERATSEQLIGPTGPQVGLDQGGKG